jgi:hypothetical protein
MTATATMTSSAAPMTVMRMKIDAPAARTMQVRPPGTGRPTMTRALLLGAEGAARKALAPAARGAAGTGQSAPNRRWRTCPIPTLSHLLLLQAWSRLPHMRLQAPCSALALQAPPCLQVQASAGAAFPRIPPARGRLPLGAPQGPGARRVPQHPPWRLLRAHTVLASVCLSFDTTLHPPSTPPRPAQQPGCPLLCRTVGLRCRAMAAWLQRLWTHAGPGQRAAPWGHQPATAAAQQAVTMAATAAALQAPAVAATTAAAAEHPPAARLTAAAGTAGMPRSPSASSARVGLCLPRCRCSAAGPVLRCHHP